MFTAPVYLLVGLINLFAKKQNYNIKMDDDPDFQIRVKRDMGTAIGDLHDREHIINMLKNHRIERMKRDTPKYNFDQLNMPYTNGNPQISQNYTDNSKDYNPYKSDYTYDYSTNTASPIVKRSDRYAYNNPTTNKNFDPFYNVKNNQPSTINGYYNSNNLNNGYYNNNNPNTGNYNQNNGYYANNNGYYTNNNGYNANNNGYNGNNIQLSYPNNGYNNNNPNNGYYNNNINQNSVSNIQKIEPRNRNYGQINVPTEKPTETSTITILEGNIFRFGSRCPLGMIKIGKKCMKPEDLE